MKSIQQTYDMRCFQMSMAKKSKTILAAVAVIVGIGVIGATASDPDATEPKATTIGLRSTSITNTSTTSRTEKPTTTAHSTTLTSKPILTTLTTTIQLTSKWTTAAPTTIEVTTQATKTTTITYPITVIDFTSPIAPGNMATLTIQGKPDSVCSITVRYKSGPSKADGLEQKTSGPDGIVSWTWKVGINTTKGTWPIDLAGAGYTESLILIVE